MLLDINHARIVHLEWELKLEETLRRNRRHIKIVSHHNCMLGVWLYTEGMVKYKQTPEILRLEELHRNFHDLAQQVADAISQKQDRLAGELFDELQLESREIVYLLTLIELKVVRQKRRFQLLRHPISSLRKIFS
ncbi:MAG: CZB domain-containing protein [Gammaproteobacteria bacterium]|nr:CZB domain-containing protein [Gammaproteobacteria bacterium]